MPEWESQDEDPDGTAQRRRTVIVSLVVGLHALLALLLILGLNLPILPETVRTVEITLPPQQQRPPEPPRMPRVVRPEKMDAPAPAFEIALPPQPTIATAAQSPVTAPPGGGMGTGGTGSGGNGSGQGGRLKLAAPVLLDPNCETLDAYTTRVRSAISRYFEYSAQAKEARIQGEVMVHFISDPQGHILQSSITGSQIERLSPNSRAGGHTQSLGIMFNRTGDERWSWAAMMHEDGGSGVPLGSGTVSADGDNGLVHVPDRVDDTLMVDLPESLNAGVPRLSLHLGHASDLFLLEKSVRRTLDRAQPLPKIPECLKLTSFNAMMPFNFVLKNFL